MEPKREVTSISLSKKTKERLRRCGKMGESYEEVIIKLLKFRETNTKITPP